MSSHHRSGGPPSLMDDVHDFDRNFHSHRFEGGRGGHGRGGGMRGRGGGEGGGMRGRGGGEGGFIPRGGSRGGRGDFHQRDRFNNNNNNFNRPNDEQHGGGGQSKVPSLFDVDQQQSRSFDRNNNNRGGGRGRMPFPRGGGGRDLSGDDRNHHLESKSDGPPSLLDYANEKSGLSATASSNSLPSLLSVQVENSGVPSPGSDPNKTVETHKEHHHRDSSNSRSDHSSHRDNEDRYRDRDSHKSNRGGFNRSSSFNRSRSRSPRDRDRDRNSSSRNDRPFGGDHRRGGGRGGRGGPGGDHFGRGGRGGHHNNSRDSHQSRFGPDNNQPPWQDRREGGGRGGGRGGFHDRPRDMGDHQRPNEQFPPDNHLFNRNGRPNYDAPSSQNRPFQEGFQHANYDSMGPTPPPSHNRPNLPPPNFNQGPPSNRPDFYPPNANNSSYQQHNNRGGRPSRFSDRQDDYEDDRPLTKPNFSLPNVTATTTPLYINQPTNPTFSQPRPSMSSTFSSQQPPAGMFQQGAPTHNQPPSQFSWPNQQQPGASNAYMNQSLASLASGDQQSSNMSGLPSSNSFYGNTNDFPRQPSVTSTNQYYTGVPSLPSQTGGKSSNANPQPTPSLIPSQQQQQQAPSTAGTAAATNANDAAAWQQYYQYWQYMQQQQQQQQQPPQAGVQPPSTQTAVQQQFQQSHPGSTTAPKQPASLSSTATNPQDPALAQANSNAWTQYWIQYQAYIQQQQQSQASSTTNSTTIAAPSQLYAQATGKQQQPSLNSTSNTNTLSNNPPISNWQTWFNPKG